MDCCANLKDPTIMAKWGATLHQPEEHKKSILNRLNTLFGWSLTKCIKNSQKLEFRVLAKEPSGFPV